MNITDISWTRTNSGIAATIDGVEYVAYKRTGARGEPYIVCAAGGVIDKAGIQSEAKGIIASHATMRRTAKGMAHDELLAALIRCARSNQYPDYQAALFRAEILKRMTHYADHAVPEAIAKGLRFL